MNPDPMMNNKPLKHASALNSPKRINPILNVVKMPIYLNVANTAAYAFLSEIAYDQIN